MEFRNCCLWISLRVIDPTQSAYQSFSPLGCPNPAAVPIVANSEFSPPAQPPVVSKKDVDRQQFRSITPLKSIA